MSQNDPSTQVNTSNDRADSPDSAPEHEGAPRPEDVTRETTDPAGPGRAGDASANIGVVGLAVMGSNLARNLARREGNTVAI